MKLPRCVVFKLQMSLSCEGTANIGPKKPLSDHMSIMEPKDEILPTTPSQNKSGELEGPSVTQPVEHDQHNRVLSLCLEAGYCSTKTFNNIFHKNKKWNK